MSRDELINKIDARTFFIPMHEQQVFQNVELLKGESYTVAEELSRKRYPPSSLSLQGGRACVYDHGVGGVVAGQWRGEWTSLYVPCRIN